MSGLKFNVLSECGVDQTPGIEMKLKLACICDVDDPFPDFVGTTNQGDSITITDDILMKTGKYWFEIDIVTDTGMVENNQVGTHPSTSYEQKISGKTVTGKNYAEFFNNNRNGCMLGIATEKTGDNRLVGHPKKGYAYLTNVKETTGSKNDTEKVWSFELIASPGFPAPYYEGASDLTP